MLIEYIGYDCFQTADEKVHPKYVLCIIQINTDDGFVSDSPYLHSFDVLEQVHQQIEEKSLEQAIHSLIEQAADNDNISTIYVLDENEAFLEQLT